MTSPQASAATGATVVAAAGTSSAASVDLVSHARALQSILADLGTVTIQQVVTLFRQYGDAADFPAVLKKALPEIVTPHAQVAAEITAQWYDEINPASTFEATPVVDLVPERIDKSIDWALYAPTKRRVPEAAPTEPAQPTQDDVLARLSGSAQRMVYDASRDTVTSNAASENVRWARVAQPDACAFCRVLATRSGNQLYGAHGLVSDVKTRTQHLVVVGRRGRQRGTQGLGEKYHDFCRCTAVPVRGDETYVPPAETAQWQTDYQKAFNSVPKGTRYDNQNGVLKAVLKHMRANTDAS